MISRILDEPYRFFFPIGVVLCLLGILYWPLKIAGIGFADTPTEFHKHLMLFGFMQAFVIGFLTTALPRLTQTGPLKPIEFVFIALMFFFLVAGILVGANDFTYFDFSLSLIALLLVLARRFAQRRRDPPETFVFLPAAFLCALTGSIFLSLLHFGWMDVAVAELYVMGLQMLNEGYWVCLILGVGGFLMRSLFGLAPPLQSTPGGAVTPPAFRVERFRVHLLMAGVIVLSYPAGNLLPLVFPENAILIQKLAAVLRVSCVSLEAFWQIGLHHHIFSSRPVELFLRISLVCILVGMWIRALLTSAQYDVSLEHLVLAAGFGLATLSVATRVVLSHGGMPQLLQKWSWPVFISLLLLLMGALTRVFAFVSPDVYAHHLAYASLIWAAGVILWAGVVLRRVIH